MGSFVGARSRVGRGWYTGGELYLELGRFEEAVTNYTRALEIEPTLACAQRGRAEALRKLQDLRWCPRRSRTTGRPGPLPSDALRTRVYALASVDRFDEALADLNVYIERVPDKAFAFFERGYVRQRLHDDAAAEADYARATELSPAVEESIRELRAVPAQPEQTLEQAHL